MRGIEGGTERKRKCEGFDRREGFQEGEGAPRREGDLLHENEFTMPNMSATCWENPRTRAHTTTNNTTGAFLTWHWLDTVTDSRQEMETAEIPGKLDSAQLGKPRVDESRQKFLP